MPDVIDTLNSFVLEFRQGLSTFNIDEFKKASGITESSWISNTADGLMSKIPASGGLGVANLISPDLYVSYIQRTIENLDNISVDVESLDSFFSNVYKSITLGERNITIPLRPDEDIEKIRPEYLSLLSSDFDTTIQKILKGSISDSDIRKKFVSDEYYNKLKKQLVKTTVVINDVRDMMELDSPSIVKIDNVFIQHNVIPFIRAYLPNTKDMRAIAVKTMAAITSLYRNMTASITSVQTMLDGGKVTDANTIRLLKYYVYNMKTVTMNLCAYISTMVIRKISYLSFNISSYMELYNIIQRYFPEMEAILHESVMTGDVRDIDNTTLLNSIINNGLSIVLPHIHKAIGLKKMEIANILSSKYDIKMDYISGIDNDTYVYDTRVYSAVNATIKEIGQNLQLFVANSKNLDMIADDIIEKSNLSETFSLKYANILTNITNMNYYTINSPDINNSSDTMMSLCNEICNFERNIGIIADNMSKCYKYLENIVCSYEINHNNLETQTFEELKAFVSEMMSNYKEYIVHVTRRLLERLDSLTEILNNDIDLEEDNIVKQDTPCDYSCEAYRSAYDEIEIHDALIFESLLTQYHSIKEKKERGVNVVYEAIETTTGGESSQPKVEGKPQEQQGDDNKDTTGVKSNDSQDGGKKKSVLEEFKNFISRLLEKFKSNSKKYTSKNNSWIRSVKNDILGLDFSNTTITVAKFEGVTSQKISADIAAAVNKINAMSSSKLPSEMTSDRSGAEFYLFPNIPEKVGDETTFVGRIKRFYTFGNTKNNDLISYSGSDAKTAVTTMIEFCESYDNTYTSVSSSLSKLSDSAYKKQQEIVNAKSANDANETNDDKPSKVSTSSIITSIVRDYSGAVSTILEKKYLDYIKVLNQLVPKNKTTDTPKEADKSEDATTSDETNKQ